jgi:hypothetical protein
MSGDSINSLNMVEEQPLNLTELEYTKRLLEPFEDIVIERFNDSTVNKSMSSSSKGLFVFVGIGLVLLLNFPKVRQRSGLNDYVLWLISAFLLFGVIY